MRLGAIVLGALLALATAASAQSRSLADILAEAPAGDWRAIDPANTLYMEIPGGRVVIELSPEFAPLHVANMRALAAAHYWDGAAIVRSQDNYVVQLGRDEGDTTPMGQATPTLAPEFDRARSGVEITRLRDPDTYAREVGFANGFPVAAGGGRAWMAHCYGMVGVGRGDTPESGSGAELYVVIGHAPRHLDRNVAVVGRVLQGIELLSSLPRGTGELGFYETPRERTPIRSIRFGSDVPESQRLRLEALRTDSATFREVVENRRNRDGWFVHPAGRINLCNVPLPVREAR